ncbi:MAG: RNA polymerase sigma factor [Fimbriimonas sp.]
MDAVGMNLDHTWKWAKPRDRSSVEEFRPAIFRIALSILASREWAEDLTQDVMLRLLRDPEKLKNADVPLAWVRTVTVRATLTALEAKRPTTNLPPDVPGPEFDEQAVAVAQTLARLKPEYRAILALSHGEGLTTREIADTLGIPEGTVGSRLHAARAAFRATWEDPR